MHPLSCTFPENGCVAIFPEQNNNLVFSCGAFNIKLNAVNIQPHYGLMKVNEVIKAFQSRWHESAKLKLWVYLFRHSSRSSTRVLWTATKWPASIKSSTMSRASA